MVLRQKTSTAFIALAYVFSIITAALPVPTFTPLVEAAAPTCNDSSFDTFSLGSVDGQGGWESTGPFDQEVVSNTYGYAEFGCQSLRISNAVTSGSFGDQTFSFSIPNEAGETIADSGGFSGGTRQNHFEAEFDIASTESTEQTGLALSVSPDRGDGGRMSYLSFEDSADGIDVTFYDVQGTTNPANFVPTVVATDLSRTEPHTIKFDMTFVDGASNDVVKIYIDGALVHTGTSWENYYRYDSEQAGNGNKIPTTDSLIFRAAGTAAPGTSGKGFLIDGVALETLPPDFSATQFVNDPKYVRENNGGDLTAQLVAPTFVTAVNFFVDGSTTPISGSNIGGAGASTDWWRLYTPLVAGEHEISAEVQAYGNWYDVSDTGIAYSLDLPTAEYIIPQVGQTFRPNDKVVRVKAEDEFDQFKRMVVTINSTDTTVLRNACVDQGDYMLCDVDNLNLPEGTYTASTTTYTKANNRYDDLVSEQFTIDGTKPTVSDLQVENSSGGIVDLDIVASATASDNHAVESVNFYLTEPRVSDGVCTGNGTKLAENRVFSTDIDSRYRTTLDVSGVPDGDYCVTAQSRDDAKNNSALVHQKVTIAHLVTVVPTCNGLTATIYIDAYNKIVGGPDDGTVFSGTLNGTSGDDVIVGTSGNDTINAEAGDDVICAGAGDDNVAGNEGDDTVYGGDGDDYISTGKNADTVYGEAGNDEIYGRKGHDTLYGGEGNDTIYGNEGEDTIEGGAGDDYIEGNEGADMIKGGDGDDDIYGNAGDDFLCGDNDNDYIEGGDDNDTICGSTGEDEIYGGLGDDEIDGGEDDDTIDGGDGTDVCVNGEFVSACEDTSSLVALCQDKAACLPEDLSLVGYWRFDESSGSSTAKDSSDNGNDGTYNGPTQSTNAATLGYGNMFSRDFDGTNDYVNLGNVADFTSNITVSAWVNPETMGTDRVIVSRGYDGTNTQWELKTTSVSGNVSFRSWQGSAVGVESTVTIPTGSWTHLVGTFDGTTWKIYVNGSLDNSAAGPAPISTTQDTLIGAVDNQGTPVQFWDGLIDDVRIYERVLTEDQVAELYAGECEDSGAVSAELTTLSTGGANGFRYRQKQLVKKLNNFGNPSQVDSPTPPAGFGGPEYFGGGTDLLDWDQLSAVCTVHDEYYQQLYTFDIIELMAENFAHMFGVSEEFILDIIENGTYCDPFYSARAEDERIEQELIAKEEQRKHEELMALYYMYEPETVDFAVGEDGYPVSSDRIWNACIRNFEVFIEGETKPLNCRRYHDGDMWEHPDTFVTFSWSPRLGKEIGVRGYEVATYTVPTPQFNHVQVADVRGNQVAQRTLSLTQYVAQKGIDIAKRIISSDDESVAVYFDEDTSVLSEESTTISQ